MDFVKDLLFDCIFRYLAAGSLWFGDDKSTALVKLHNGKPHMGQIDCLLIWGIREGTACTLRPALNQMPRQNALAKLLGVLLQRPTVLITQWSKRQRWIGYTTCDYNVSTIFQRFHNALYTAIGIAGDQLLPNVTQFAVKL